MESRMSNVYISVNINKKKVLHDAAILKFTALNRLNKGMDWIKTVTRVYDFDSNATRIVSNKIVVIK